MAVNSSSDILADSFGDCVWLQVNGRGCYANSPDMERYVDDRLGSGKSRFVVDLQKCQGLDSTFMGTLLRLAKRIAALPQGLFQIINAHGRNGQLLRGVGVHYFCAVSEDAAGFKPTDEEQRVQAVPHQNLSKLDQAKHCLKAHEDLATVEENAEKFSEVIELMRKKVASQPSS